MIYDLPQVKGALKPLPLAALGVVIALVIVIEVMIFDGYQQLRENTDEVSRSQETILATEGVLRGILNMETGLRGYLITGDEAFLQPYQPGREAFAVAIGRAHAFTTRHPGQQALLDKIRDLENAWRTRYVEPLISKRRALSANGAQGNEAFEVVRLGTGKAFVDEMRALIAEVQRIELERSARASAGLESYFRTSTTMVMAGSAVVLLLVIALSATLARNLRKMAQVNHLLEMEVAERKAAEAHTQTMRDRLDLALDGAGLALWDYDVRSGDVYLGPHWNEMLGGERVEVTTSIATLQKMMHPDDTGHVGKLMRDIVRGSSDSYRAEHRVQMADGNWKWIESHGKVVARDEHGVAVRMTGINADISERKEVERLKSEFVATVSHELRTPLTAIIGGLGMVRSDVFGSVPADARPLLDMAYQNSERLRDLINNILDLEKVDSGVMNYEAQVIDVVDTLRSAAALNQAYAQTLSVRFELDLPAQHPQVQADPDRLMQVLTNLLSNAAKFSPKNESVTLSCRISGDKVCIGIRDRGPGIPQDFRGRIFSKFAQADSSDTRQKGGTGLGLSIAKSLVERMRGTIDYVSEPDRGTTFSVELPLHGVVATAARAEHSRTT